MSAPCSSLAIGRVGTLLATTVLVGASFEPAPAEWPPKTLQHLDVLPRDIQPDTLVQIMGGFTRALGVRCTHCHVGEEGKPLATYDFASDAKLPKRQARTMLRMVNRINGELLGGLEGGSNPAVRVGCVTCHHGASEPRLLQDVLLAADAGGGLDSVLHTYRSLRERYYGRFTYDFGEVPLSDVGGALGAKQRLADAERLHALNVEMNPASNFAKRQHATAALIVAFSEKTTEARSRYAALEKAYGQTIVGEPLVNQVGYSLLQLHATAAAVEALRFNVEQHPESANAHDSLGEALEAASQIDAAIRSYERSLELDPKNTHAAEKLRQLRSRKRGS